ncbi:MAG TPA: hypothetical protein QGF44_02500, partial [Candidatus Nitrosopelagicus sp.]|nr:hypothetical protein [Candidatus Nitrosopelagicus sp.]
GTLFSTQTPLKAPATRTRNKIHSPRKFTVFDPPNSPKTLPKFSPDPSQTHQNGAKCDPGPETDDDTDPFDGIETDDINNYADLYDIPPPETDNEAKNLANKIKKWIQDGRPKP